MILLISIELITTFNKQLQYKTQHIPKNSAIIRKRKSLIYKNLTKRAHFLTNVVLLISQSFPF